MGLKYNKNDGQLLSSALKHNLEIANQIVEDVQEGVDHLLSMIDDPFGPLEGQAYHAAASLFQEIVKPTLSKLKEATNEIKGELTTFDNARRNFDQFPDPVYDMDDLKEHLEIKKQQKATVDFQMNLFNNQLANAIAKKVVEDFVYEGQRLQSVANHYEQELQEIEAKIRILEEFSSSTSSLFQESLHTFQNAMNGAKSLKTGSFDAQGNFSMSSNSDLSWYKKITGKDISRDLLHEPSHLTANDIEEQEVVSVNSETKDELIQIALATGLTLAQVVALYTKASKVMAVQGGKGAQNLWKRISGAFSHIDFKKKTNWEEYGREHLEEAGVYFKKDGFGYVVDGAKAVENIIKNGAEKSFDVYKEGQDSREKLDKAYGHLFENQLKDNPVIPNKPDFDPNPNR
ncbi:LXG domain-containing protein [Lactococcus petauri]|uniref:LXG domain-containing protein n=1 Tax=Lactococcus petauri TaxID=1940789 RepID=UPI001F573C2B|nr:LXG domain-containing protein [Lactococcus petauri]